MPWQRPATVPVGQVWSRFMGKKRDGQPAKMYQVRDMDDKYIQKCLDLMNETFMRDDPLGIALGIPNDPVSIATINCTWERYIAQGISLACFTETDGAPDELVGLNITLVKSRDDEEEDLEKIQGESLRKKLLIRNKVLDLVDVFTLYGVDRYLTSYGLTVLAEHRGQNIGARLLEARKPLCKSLGIQYTATVFTAAASQVLASKCGYTQLAELRYSDMLALGVDLSGCANPTAKLMGTKFNFN